MELSEKEHKLIEHLRKVVYGQVTVFIENSQPVRIEKIKESVKI